jgi:predicted component of type VI protein secretion system
MRVAAPPRTGGRAWRLVGANDVAAAFDFTVNEPALLENDSGLLIGRSARANFVIEHDSVSRNHARFMLEGGALCLEDLDSMNGTWVDGQKLEPNAPVPLQPGGIVEIGKIKLRVTGG